MIGIIAVGTAVRDVFAKRTAQARAPPAVEIVLLSYILRAFHEGTLLEQTLRPMLLYFSLHDINILKLYFSTLNDNAE